MAETRTSGGTKDSPWKLKTPSEHRRTKPTGTKHSILRLWS